MDWEEERRIAKTTAVMLKGFENDQAVATAGKEFNEAQEIGSLLIGILVDSMRLELVHLVR
jgi:hypothetical protein